MSTKASSTPLVAKNGDTEVDRFIQESCRSFRECNIKNNARRNSLQKKTLGIESERRLVSANLSREERQLREQLKQMKIEKMKNNLMHDLRESHDKKERPRRKKGEDEHHIIPTELYPVTFRSHTPSPTELDKYTTKEHKLYLIHRGRRQSREFEDLHIHTNSGKLLHKKSHIEEDDDTPRRRVFSMSNAVRPSRISNLLKSSSRSGTPSPRSSPNISRKIGTPRKNKSGKGHNSSDSSKESLNDINSLDDLHWIGEPEAIHSVRRSRKTVEEQELETEIHKLKMT